MKSKRRKCTISLNFNYRSFDSQYLGTTYCTTRGLRRTNLYKKANELMNELPTITGISFKWD